MRQPETMHADTASAAAHRIDRWLHEIGDWLMRNQRTIRRVQWGVVVDLSGAAGDPDAAADAAARRAYLDQRHAVRAIRVLGHLVAVRAALDRAGRPDVVRPAVSRKARMTEAVSKYGLGRSIPRWVRWSGWPFAAFAATTIYGQMISVYQYPAPALVILGFSTVAAIATALTVGPQQAGVVPLSVPGHRRVRGARQDCAAAFPGRHRGVGQSGRSRTALPACQLRAAGADPHR